MFGLTTTRRLREAKAQRDENARLAVDTVVETIDTRGAAWLSQRRLEARLARALRACARYRAALPVRRPVQQHDELWSLIDWSLWGSGMGDTFREQLADQFIAALTPEQHAQALELIRWWTEDRGREPLGRRRYEEQQQRLRRAVRAAARWRAHAAAERRTVRVLSEQLLDATSGESTTARAALGLPDTGPWQRAVDGLNALIDAQVPFHIEPDGHIANSCGDEHIEYDRAAGRWRLVHDDATETEAAA
ncbi:hypothetical protein [Streptomyces filamentosus]|uniref:hypothetical protein n=1 Tax=Streptomyces filamentosus TaxID=67294 RepID=UPI0037D68311